MAKVIGVKFKNAGKVYYFKPGDDEYREGEGVIVETARGVEFGTIAAAPKDVPDNEVVQPLKQVLRLATQKDYETTKQNEGKREDALKTAVEKISKHKLEMKLIDCEFTFDGSKVIFYFTAEGRIDFRELVKELAQTFKMRIELRQVGIRDEAKLLGGIAPCGRVCCCSSYLPDFKKVSIKMAKTQGLSLNPSKISGLCGRLMCCLEYENAHYSETYKIMPKIGSEVKAGGGKGTVVSNNLLKKLVKVKTVSGDSVSFKEYTLDEIKVIKHIKDEPEENIAAEIKEILD